MWFKNGSKLRVRSSMEFSTATQCSRERLICWEVTNSGLAGDEGLEEKMTVLHQYLLLREAGSCRTKFTLFLLILYSVFPDVSNMT